MATRLWNEITGYETSPKMGGGINVYACSGHGPEPKKREAVFSATDQTQAEVMVLELGKVKATAHLDRVVVSYGGSMLIHIAPRKAPNISTNTTRKVATIRKAVEEALLARERALQTRLAEAQEKVVAESEANPMPTSEYMKALAVADKIQATIQETKATSAIVFTTFDNVARK